MGKNQFLAYHQPTRICTRGAPHKQTRGDDMGTPITHDTFFHDRESGTVVMSRNDTFIEQATESLTVGSQAASGKMIFPNFSR